MFDPLRFPSPIQPLDLKEARSLGIRLYVKRDDLIPHAFGGNKVRIAAEFVADLRTKGCDALIMYGDLRSNLCRVLAMMCHEEGIPCLMVATSAEGEPSRPSFNEEIVRGFGIEVIECDKGTIAQAVDKAFELLRSRGRKPYYIYGDRTGRGNEGVPARAYAKAYREILDWEAAQGTHFDLLVTPYGTGCTQSGLICGSMAAGDQRDIVGISISSRPRERALSILDDAVREWFALEDRELPQDYASHITLDTSHTCGGYGVRDPRVDELIASSLEQTSLPLDPTYTGKALRGAFDYLAEHEIHDKDVLFLHTGGLPLFFDYLREAQEGR